MSTPERVAGDRALLRFLVRQGRVAAEDVARIEGMLDDPGLSVHEVLERENILAQKDLALLLAETLRLKIVDLTTYPLDANVTRELKENIATRYEVVPISIDERTIEVVTANPLDLDGLKAVEFATGKRVQAVVATHIEVKDALAHTYRLQESLEQFLQLVPSGESLVVNELSDDGGDLRSIAAEAELPPVIKLADKMLIEGIKSRASDIHVEPEGDSVLVRYRVDGILEEAFRFPKWIQNPLVARLKVMAKLDITERRLPQDGRIQVRYSDKSVDMRVSSLPAQHGEKITLRILDASQAVKALDRLGFSPADLKILRDAGKKPQGLVLITGPTGSGKTTTLYALLREIFSPKTNIVTIENPIEYQLKGINQVEVNEKQGLTFGGVLRSVLRQDPDVILLGEIRDKETAQIAFQAASTGHLVLSTVHTNDAAGAVTRLIDLGLEPYAIASALNLVVAQRLVRQLCPTCSKPTEIGPELTRQLHLDGEMTVKKAVGCAQCRHVGYRSRVGVYEMLPMTVAMTKLIEAGAGESMVRQQARTEGLHSLLEDAVGKLKTGQTTIEELQRVVQITAGDTTECPGCQREIAEDYSVCPHCSKVLHATCGGCAKPLSSEWVRCPYCGTTADAPAEVAAAPAERRTFKALVVDDTATIRDIVSHTLQHSDLGLAAVLTAENGPEALEIAGRERPDIVILDISMPGMDGFEVCRRLRSEMRTAFVPVLMLTAHDSEEDVARGFGVGADDYMLKPVRREQLVARVRRILERTYGSQALGAPPPVAATDVPAGPEATAYAHAATPMGPDVTAALAELTADRDALRRAIAGCETRIGELAARPVVVEGPATGGMPDAAAVAELRELIAEVRASQERDLQALRAETERALALAEEAVRSASTHAAASASAVSVDQLAAMTTTVERLQGEQARLASAEAERSGAGADEECERRLQQVTAAIQERAQNDATAVVRLGQAMQELRGEVEAQRDALVRDGARMRSAEELAHRAQDDGLAAAEKTARELAALQRAIAEQQDLRQHDEQRLAGTEESMRRGRVELQAAVARADEEIVELRRLVAQQQEGRGQSERRIAESEDVVQRLRQEVAMATEAAVRAAQEELAARVGTLWADTESSMAGATEQIAELRRLVAEQHDRPQRNGDHAEALDAAVAAARQAAVAAAETAAREARAEAVAVAERTAQELVAFRGMVSEQHEAQQQEIQWMQGRLGQARRAAVKLVRRVRAAASAADARTAAREEECEQHLATVRDQVTTALQALRDDHAALARVTGEPRTDDEARDRLASEVAELRTDLVRVDGEQRRYAADVEERLRGLMRTAAGGFDVQLALLRGKVEVLARTLRQRVPLDAQPDGGDQLLEHRHGLLERLRQQLVALQSGTDWRPQRVLDLLIESTLAAAVTPFRRMLQLADSDEPTVSTPPGDEAPAPSVTDESASPS